MNDKILQRWRKSHREPGKMRSMTTETASKITGLSWKGYMKQAVGERRLSRQTALLLVAWELLPMKRREVFLEVAGAFKDAIESPVRFDFSFEDSLDQSDEEEHFFDRFLELLELRCHYIAERASTDTQADTLSLDAQIAENRTELRTTIDQLVMTIDGTSNSKNKKANQTKSGTNS